MDELELFGAPLTWLWLFVLAQILALPALVQGLRRRGTGKRYEKRFWLQRAPQCAIALALVFITLSFEAIELRLGTGQPSFGERLFVLLGEALPVLSLALVLPEELAGVLAWFGIALVVMGIVFFICGLYTLSSSFSTDAELFEGHELHREGPFRFVLHPVYSGYTQFLVGSSVVSLSPVALGFTLLVVVPLLLQRAKYEESLLRQEFGNAYLELEETVRGRRLIPTFFPVGF